METSTTTWTFDVDDVDTVPRAISEAVRKADRQDKQILDGPKVERLETSAGERWVLTFKVGSLNTRSVRSETTANGPPVRGAASCPARNRPSYSADVPMCSSSIALVRSRY
jgi:hypothetical protein